MKTLLVSLALFFSTTSMAETCHYSLDSEAIEFNWTAFKTPEKAPVRGTFADLGFKKENYHAKDLSKLMTQLEFSIDTSSVRTKNTARDANIVKWFFQQIAGGMNFTGKVKRLTDKSVVVDVTANKVTKTITMSRTSNNNNLIATSTLNLMDFNLSKALASINKACYELHNGKTWEDVDIKATFPVKKECK